MDLEQIEDTEREAEAIMAAERTAKAFHQPKLLAQERHEFQMKLAIAGQVEDAFAAARRITAKLEKGLSGGDQGRSPRS